MKVALIHDVYIEWGGAERVLLKLLDIFPAADVYIPLINDRSRTLLEEKYHKKVTSSLLNHIPFIHSASVLLKPLLFWYWESLDLKAYDLVISSSHSFSSKSVITGANTLHVSYIHTPPRYLYTEFNETRLLQVPWVKVLLTPLLSWLRAKDYLGGQRPDMLLANSKTVQKRIQKYYRRSSQIVHPPISIPATMLRRKPSYFLVVSRLAKQKGIELAIKACNQESLPLVIVGKGAEEQYLRSLAGPTISFRGFVEDNKMSAIYAQAKALIYCSQEEDFGMIPVEAMAHGVPVIGYKSGGVVETVLAGKTGLLFGEYTVGALLQALDQFSRKTFSAATCRKRAQVFSEAVFVKKIKALTKI